MRANYIEISFMLAKYM